MKLAILQAYRYSLYGPLLCFLGYDFGDVAKHIILPEFREPTDKAQ
jgi:hypothetical protein